MLRAFFHPSNIGFDLSNCSRSANGWLHVALGQHVFKWPLDRLPLFEDLEPPLDKILAGAPPNPKDPRGCPDNPYPVQAIGIDFAADGTILLSPAANDVAAFLQIKELLPGQSWRPMVQAHEEVFQMVCDGAPTVTPQGLMRCSSDKSTDPNQKRKNQSRYMTHLKALPDVYADPFGEPFYVRCPDHSPPQCQVDYSLFEDVVLAYEFLRDQLKISKVIEFDRDLRAMLAAAVVEDFVWR